jgi:hypothetical protein
MWGAKTGLAVFLFLYWYWEWPILAKYSIALFLSWGIVLGLGLMGTQIPV